MDLIRPIVRHVTFDYFLRRDGHRIAAHAANLASSQYVAASKLADSQFERLRGLLSYCAENNSFYRERFNRIGLAPASLTSLQEFQRVPALTKDDIRLADDRLFSRGYSRQNTVHRRTGGSTGVPLHTHMDVSAVAFKKAATLRHNRWAHLVPGDRLAAIWGDTDKPQPFKVRLRNALTDRAFYLDTLRFDEPHLRRFVAAVRRFHPPVLMGHAHSIYRFAEYTRDQGIHDIAFKGIITTAMVLTDPERHMIEATFRSPVFNRYGCEELSIIASECEAHAGLHICAEGLLVEVVDEGPGRPGRLVITDLVNHAMPMIRYEIGDYAISQPGDCACGRGLPRLKEVVGRTADFLYTPDKKPVFGISILDTFVIHIPGFKQVQMVQKRFEHLDVYIVKDGLFCDASLALLQKNIHDVFGPRMTYDVHFVESIAQTEQGKYRFSICDIPVEERP